MLKIAQGKLEEVRDSYTEETPALTSELFAMREMGDLWKEESVFNKDTSSVQIILTRWITFHLKNFKVM